MTETLSDYGHFRMPCMGMTFGIQNRLFSLPKNSPKTYPLLDRPNRLIPPALVVLYGREDITC